MAYYYSEKDFISNCPCAFSIISFAENILDEKVYNCFDSANQDSVDTNCYRATFSFYPVNSIDRAKLCQITIKCIITKEKHLCEVINRVDNFSK